MKSPSPDWRAILSWALYDFANTMFSMNIVSRYFYLWILEDKGKPDYFFTSFYSFSMLAVAMTIPLLGAKSDRFGRRIPFLILFTSLSVLFTAGLGLPTNPLLALAAFAVANYCYHSAMVFYNALIPAVSRGLRKAVVSGIGVSLGYFGAIVGLLAVAPFVSGEHYASLPPPLSQIVSFLLLEQITEPSQVARINAFLPTALLFLLFALPCFFIREAGQPTPSKRRSRLGLRAGFLHSFTSLRRAASTPCLGRFLLGHFLYMDAIHTVIIAMSVYASQVMGFSHDEIHYLLIASTMCAALGSIFIGFLASSIGNLPTLKLVLVLWCIAVILALVAVHKIVFWIAAFLMGVGLGAIWVVTRVVLIDLSPPEHLGESFGLYGLTGKCAAIVGPQIWGWLAFVFAFLGQARYRIAACSLLLFVIAGLAIIAGIPTRRLRVNRPGH